MSLKQKLVNKGFSLGVIESSLLSNIDLIKDGVISNINAILSSNIIGNNRHHPYYFGIGNYAYVGFGHGSLPGPGSNPSSSPYIYNDFYNCFWNIGLYSGAFIPI